MKKYAMAIIVMAVLTIGIFGYMIYTGTNLFNFGAQEEVDYLISVDDDCNVTILEDAFEGKNNVVKFSDDSDSGTAKYTKTFAEKTTGKIKFSIYIDADNKKAMYISVKSGLEYAVKLHITNLNRIQYYYDDDWHTLKRYNKDTWIAFEIEFNVHIDRYTLTIDGETELENKMFYDKNHLESVDTLIFETVKVSENYNVYIADLTIN